MGHDPAMRGIAGGKAAQGSAVSPSQMGCFEIGWLASESNPSARSRLQAGGPTGCRLAVHRDEDGTWKNCWTDSGNERGAYPDAEENEGTWEKYHCFGGLHWYIGNDSRTVSCAFTPAEIKETIIMALQLFRAGMVIFI